MLFPHFDKMEPAGSTPGVARSVSPGVKQAKMRLLAKTLGVSAAKFIFLPLFGSNFLAFCITFAGSTPVVARSVSPGVKQARKRLDSFGKSLVLALFSAIFLIFFTPSRVQAMSFSITDISTSLIQTNQEEVGVVLSIRDLPSGISYFRVAWIGTEESTQYFGSMKNDRGEWREIEVLSSANCVNYFQVEGPGDRELLIFVKMSEEKELGEYFLRAHRFTSTCKTYLVSENIFPILYEPKISPSPELAIESTPTELSPPDYELFINEIMPDPEGEDEADMPDGEWIELYNPEKKDLLGFYIEDESGHRLEISQNNSRVFESGLYWVVYRNRSSFSLNNTGDSIFLYSGEYLIDDMFYDSTKNKYSWSRVDGDWCLADASPGRGNNACKQSDDGGSEAVEPSSTQTPTPSPKPAPSPTIKIKKNNILGASDSAEATESSSSAKNIYDLVSDKLSTPEASNSSEGKNNIWLVLVLIGLGLGSLAFSTYYFYQSKQNI